jgi:hypothetical protein
MLDVPLDALAYLAAAINSIAGAVAVFAALRRHFQPNPVSWAIWAATGWIAFAGQISAGVGAPALLTLTVAVVASLILLACYVEIGLRDEGAYLSGQLRTLKPFVTIHLHPSWSVHRLDAVCGLLAVLTLIAWQITASDTLAIALSIVVDALAGIPTIAKAYRAPHTEQASLYLAAIASGGLTLASVRSWTFDESAFAVYFLLLNIVIAVPVTFDRIRQRRAIVRLLMAVRPLYPRRSR